MTTRAALILAMLLPACGSPARLERASSSESATASSGGDAGGSGGTGGAASSSSVGGGATTGGTGGDPCSAVASPPVSDNCLYSGSYQGTCEFGLANACATTPVGYLCPDNGPPFASGCVVSVVSAGGTAYCCAEDSCVRYSDTDSFCSQYTAGAQPTGYSCPGHDAGQPGLPSGCVWPPSSGNTWCCP